MTHGLGVTAAEVLRSYAQWHPGVFIPLLVLAIIIIAAAGLHAAAQRRKELREWATDRGLVFSSAKTSHLAEEYPEFACLHQGHSRYAHNLMQGRWGQREILGFDYHYVTGSGRNRQRHRLSAVILESEVLLQPLLVRPESLFDKMSAFFGFDDIDFESADFSRRFFVKAVSKRWAHDVIHPRAMEFLLSQPPFSIQFDLRCVICYRERLFRPGEFEAACQVAAGLLDRLPDYVIRQQGGRRQGNF